MGGYSAPSSAQPARNPGGPCAAGTKMLIGWHCSGLCLATGHRILQDGLLKKKKLRCPHTFGLSVWDWTGEHVSHALQRQADLEHLAPIWDLKGFPFLPLPSRRNGRRGGVPVNCLGAAVPSERGGAKGRQALCPAGSFLQGPESTSQSLEFELALKLALASRKWPRWFRSSSSLGLQRSQFHSQLLARKLE